MPSLLYFPRCPFSPVRALRLDVLQDGRQRGGDQAAAIPDRAGHQVAHLPVGALELRIQDDGQGDEDADQHHELQGHRGGEAGEAPAASCVLVA